MDATLNTSIASSPEEPDQLISILRQWGIGYLVGGYDVHPSLRATDRQAMVGLVQRLAQCDTYPRIRDASVSLFLLHPEFADAILEAIQTSEPELAEKIAVLTLATLYLQRLWSIRLTFALGHPPAFPEQPFAFLWRNRHLPPLAYHDGKWGLVALQTLLRERSDLPLNYIGDWQNQIDHLLYQQEHHYPPSSVPSLQLLEHEYEDEQESAMSMRPPVDKAQIENFLKNLGRTFRKPGRLYLVGGAALVHMGIRQGSTEDIDVQAFGENSGEMVNAIRQLVQQMNINVEGASPETFIPLPKQWMALSKFVGRYGAIDVFYFDFYSIALTKILRGNTRDINDVKLLVQKKVITLQELDAAYQEVFPEVGNPPYEWLDPEDFSKRYNRIRQLL